MTPTAGSTISRTIGRLWAWCALTTGIFAASSPAAALDSISLYGYTINVLLRADPTVDESVAAGTRVARIVPMGNGFQIPCTYSISDTINFRIESDATGGPYIKSKAVFDYESGIITYPLTITADNGLGSVLARSFIVHVNPINDNTAIFQDLSYAMTETSLVSIDIRAMNTVTDADVPASNNSWNIDRIIDLPKYGSLAWTPQGSFIYNPRDSGFEPAADSFSYYIADFSTSDPTYNHSIIPYWIHVSIANINDEIPVGLPDTIRVSRGGLYTGSCNLLANDFDLDNLGGLSVSALTDSAQHGSISINPDGTFSYRHDGSNTLADAFSYTIFDGRFTSAPVPVVLLVKQGIVPIDSNYYRDVDADGIMDRIDLSFDNAVQPLDLDSHAFFFTWKDRSGNVITLAPGRNDWVINPSANTVIRWDIPKSFDLARFTTSLSGTCGEARMIYRGDTSALTVSDAMAPVPSAANLRPGRSGSDGNLPPDTLSITFSEACSDLSTEEPFLFTQQGSPYRISALPKSSGPSFSRNYLCTHLDGVVPLNGDSMAMAASALGTDALGNIQSRSTANIPLIVLATKIGYDIKTFPSPWQRGADRSYLKKILGSAFDGVIIAIEPYGATNLGPVSLQVSGSIYDCLGNAIASIDSSDAVINTYNSVFRICLPWDGRNESGRLVGPGSYVAKLRVTTIVEDPTLDSGFSTFEEEFVRQILVQ